MSSITISNELRDQLLQSSGEVNLVDPAGNWIGKVSVRLPDEPTLEELERDLASVKHWVTADEVNQRLRELTKCE